MKQTLFYFFYLLIFTTVIAACNGSSNKSNPKTDVAVNVSEEAANAYTDSASEVFWKPEMYKDQLFIPKTIEDKTTATIEIRAFQHQFSNSIPKTWVIGYVDKDNPKLVLPGPTFETHNNTSMQVKWVNKLDETIINNTDYPTFKYKNKAQKYYPIIYNVNNPLFIPGLADGLYPANVDSTCNFSKAFKNKEGGEVCKCPDTTEMAAYYSSTVHLHGAWVSWHDDGYPNSFFLNTEATTKACNNHFPKEPINFGLFGPQIMDENNKPEMSRTYNYSNTFGEAQNYNSITKTLDSSSGKHGAILWYHDHAMMRTASNVYCGLEGSYIIEGENENNKLNSLLGFDLEHPNNTKNEGEDTHDIPLMITDKSFTKNGYLFYNTTQHDSMGEGGQPEFYGQTIIVNGKVWPNQNVDKGLYRYRLLNGSSSRFYSFALLKKQGGKYVKLNNDSIFYQIGTEGGILPLQGIPFPNITFDNSLTLAPGERADVLINFSELNSNDTLYMVNRAVNGPFQQYNESLVDLDWINRTDSNITNFVMRFVVKNNEKCKIINTELVSKLIDWQSDAIKIKNLNKLPILNADDDSLKINNKVVTRENLINKPTINEKKRYVRKLNINDKISNDKDKYEIKTRKLTIINNSAPSKVVPIKTFKLELVEYSTFDELIAALPIEIKPFWQAKKASLSYPLVLLNNYDWNAEAFNDKEIYRANNLDTVIWEIHNKTGDAHPIHLHLNRFQIIGRMSDTSKVMTGRAINEMGWKDVVRVDPHSTTYIKVQFVLTEKDVQNKFGQFVYHCHILEHEDMSMMKRMVIINKP